MKKIHGNTYEQNIDYKMIIGKIVKMLKKKKPTTQQLVIDV